MISTETINNILLKGNKKVLNYIEYSVFNSNDSEAKWLPYFLNLAPFFELAPPSIKRPLRKIILIKRPTRLSTLSLWIRFDGVLIKSDVEDGASNIAIIGFDQDEHES